MSQRSRGGRNPPSRAKPRYSSGPQRKQQNNTSETGQPPCPYFRKGSCRFGRECRFSHGRSLRDTRHTRPNLQEARDEQQIRSDYNAWRRIIKRKPQPNADSEVRELWSGALNILDCDEREFTQMLPRDLEDEENYFGRKHIQLLLASRSRPGASESYIRLVQPFLRVITHASLLECLSVDTSVGALYNFIGGTNGTRAVPFFLHVCEMLIEASTATVKLIPPVDAQATLASTSRALQELLRREPRARLNDDFPDLFRTMELAAKSVCTADDSEMATVLKHQLSQAKMIVERARGLLHEERDIQEVADTTVLESIYPHDIVMPSDRHDNDQKDIAKIKIFPTHSEIMSDETGFLPSTDMSQPHFLVNPAERHIDTQFRLLRHDVFGEMRNVLGVLLHSMKDPESRSQAHLGDFRAHQYKPAFVSYVSFEGRTGLRMDLAFPQPLGPRKMSKSERYKWWEESRRLTEGVLLCFIARHNDRLQQLFLIVTEKNLNPTQGKTGVTSDKEGTITAKLATCDEVNVDCAIQLSRVKTRGLLLEFPGILPATFVPILENLQNMQRLTRLPFRQAILPDMIEHFHRTSRTFHVQPPFYTQKPGFRFSLAPLFRADESNQTDVEIDPHSTDTVDIIDMALRTGLDHGQCRALLAALSREYAFIQGPPGTGKSYLGIQLMKVLMHHKSSADLGPVIIVCYTNHALDQFLEHLLAIGIKKIIRIGGTSKSSLLENHNLRHIARSESKTRSESYLLARNYESLDAEAKGIKGDLGKIHVNPRLDRWLFLKYHLSRKYHRIYAQFNRHDEDGFESVGRHPFELWAPKSAKGANVHDINASEPFAGSLKDVLLRAEKDVCELSQTERRDLVDFWIQEIRHNARTDLCERIRGTIDLQQQITNIHDEVDRRVLQQADVIGLTTTGLAKRITVLERVKCKVVICEEAGEVMEPHMISALLPTVEHFIQIGDHQQLRPQINNFVALSLESKQGEPYQLDRSQFERLSMGANGRQRIPVAQLNVQRRMRPEISTLIRETIYPKLEDHSSTTTFPDVMGMRKNVFWLDHYHFEEGQHSDMQHRSHSNVWEASMVHSLVRHIVRQGVYSSSDIAVLTPYTGQLQKLRSMMRSDFEIVLSNRDEDALEKDGFHAEHEASEATAMQRNTDQTKTSIKVKKLTELLRLATVDNFQGEEAKIVIVSLVRSNQDRRVGFLKTTNRINVLLSRAQHGMYLIGNVETYSKIQMWQDVVDRLRTSDSVKNSLELCCPRHKETMIEVAEPEDFLRLSPEGGCKAACTWRLPSCGHMCQSRCHSERMHDVWQCPNPCQRLHEPCGHMCHKICGEDCGKCPTKLTNFLLPCGHSIKQISCHLAQNPSDIACKTRVSKKVPACSHVVEVQCHIDVTSDNFRCSAPCETILACGHRCPGNCAKCGQKENDQEAHLQCQKLCGRLLSSCSHHCRQRCHDGRDCAPCILPCEVQCPHSRCMLECHKACSPCVEKCTWSCEHQGACTMPCSAPCNRLPCHKRCSKQLACGHQCPGLCGETCPEKFCHACGMQQDARVDLLEMKTYANIDVDENPIILLNCGHFFTAETLDGMVKLHEVYSTNKDGQITQLKDLSGALAAQLPRCPDCQRPIRQHATHRYNRMINQAVLEEMSKRFVVDGQRELRELEGQLETFDQELDSVRSSLHSATNARRSTANNPKQPRHRQNSHRLVKQRIEDLLRTFADRHQPARKLYEAQVLATRRCEEQLNSRSSRNVETSFSVIGDQRVVLGARMLLIRIDCIILEDLTSVPDGATATSVRSSQSYRSLRKLMEQCIQFTDACKTASLHRLSVEASLCFAKGAWLCQAANFKTVNKRMTECFKAAQGMLEQAVKLCDLGFHNAEHLKVAVEKSLKLLSSTRYETVTPEELALVKEAMVNGRGGMATHSGHWYQCANGHPFAIGECGMPMEQARCPECGSPIGGLNHQAVDGVTRAIDMED